MEIFRCSLGTSFTAGQRKEAECELLEPNLLPAKLQCLPAAARPTILNGHFAISVTKQAADYVVQVTLTQGTVVEKRVDALSARLSRVDLFRS